MYWKATCHAEGCTTCFFMLHVQEKREVGCDCKCIACRMHGAAGKSTNASKMLLISLTFSIFLDMYVSA